MGRQKIVRSFMCDFETTVYDGQDYTEVWASASVEFGTEDVNIFHSIDEQFEYFWNLGCNVTAYYHNLKFDGTFIVSWLMEHGFTQGFENIETGDNKIYKWSKKLKNNEFSYMISDKGMWYTIKVKKHNKVIEIRDSLKLLPFSVKEIGKAFKTKHQKLDMEYKGLRYAGCRITDEEKQYIANDVLVVKEALEVLFAQGHDKLTIGSNCLEEFKSSIGEELYDELFPNVYEIELDPKDYTQEDAGSWILKSYRGGWCYLAKGKENKIYKEGVTADVNSLYPSIMHSESGNKYPVGYPTFWKGNYIPDNAIGEDRYFFVRIKTRFRIKDGYLPFIQIKGDWFYSPTESLETSDFYNPITGKYYRYREGLHGEKIDSSVILTLTMTDYYLILDHYNLMDMEILGGCYFFAMSGIFDKYIDKYRKIKMESKGALRTLAKLFLNNLYGKMASSTNSSFKVCYQKEDGSIGFIDQDEHDKKPGFIPVGSAITSYARNFTIRAAQKNYHGVDKGGFIYADTDSIHCDLKPEEVKGIKVDPVNFCCWKLESTWDKAIFVRQKTYIEHVVQEDLEDCPPYYSVKCAGLPEKCKELFIDNITGRFRDIKYSNEDIEFLLKDLDLTDFKRGLKIPGKLIPKRIKGGTLLVETTYEMR